MREGLEESNGFLAENVSALRKSITKSGGFYEIEHNGYHVHIISHEYDLALPKYYNRNYSFMWNHMDRQYLNKRKLFEKSHIEWFTIDDMKRRRGEFRNF